MAEIRQYGAWQSPITSDLIVAGSINLGQIKLDGDKVYWSESRPTEAGRYVVVQWSPDGSIRDLNPPPFNARTRVHEYGGGSFTVQDGTLYFSDFIDQKVYWQAAGSDEPVALTPESSLRFADGVIDVKRDRLISVQEDHSNAGQEAVNTIVSVSLEDGKKSAELAAGYDFFSTPRLSPDGKQLAWLSWRHPNMPWDGTELWLGELNDDGTMGQAKIVAGGKHESVFQPEWSPDGMLYFISDRTGWWNLYRWHKGEAEALYSKEADFGQPQWVFGMSTYGFAAANRIICTYVEGGFSRLASLNTDTKQLEPIETAYNDIHEIKVQDNYAVLNASSATLPTSIVRINLSTGEHLVLRRATELKLDSGYLSVPEAIEFPTENGLTAHAFYYAPNNKDFVAPEGEKPPLVVFSHGGPTGATSAGFSLSIQFWTSRGFGIVDVNYGGSTGYGRAYRERLNGTWGIVDVDDSVNAARYLVAQGKADGERLAIRGGSAGGFTTLAALTFRDVFKVGASYFGVSDLEALAKETHKFESRYLDNMVGAYPEQRDLYVERSPINFTDKLNCALILFQGLEDAVVPPNQAEMMFEAVKQKGLPVAYVPFEGEQHGFRQAKNIKRSLDAELYFYAKVFGFEPADVIEPVQIENL